MPSEDRQMLQGQRLNLTGDEARALGTTTGAVGGYLVPDSYLPVLQAAMLWYGGMTDEICGTITTDRGEDILWPTFDGTAKKGRRIGQNQQVNTNDVAFGLRGISAYTYTSDAVLVPFQLLQDSVIDVDGLLNEHLAERLGRIKNEDLTLGTGASEPQGVVGAVTVGRQGATGQSASVTYDDLVLLEHSIDPAYRSRATCRYMMNDSSIAVIRRIKDGEGRPLYVVARETGETDTLHGYPITPNNDMPEMAASEKSLIFGNFKRGYLIRNVRGVYMVRTTERYVDFGQVGFFAFIRLDGGLIEPRALRAYQNSAA
jgi:HK97 family phage major capsid protein